MDDNNISDKDFDHIINLMEQILKSGRKDISDLQKDISDMNSTKTKLTKKRDLLKRIVELEYQVKNLDAKKKQELIGDNFFALNAEMASSAVR